MKQTDKRLLMLLILIASAYIAFAQTLLYVDRISKEDFAKALNSKYVFVYDIWRDSVVENAITDRIILDARQRFEKLDSNTRLENYDIGFEGDEYEAMFSSKSLILVERYGMYWFMLPSLHDCELYCYDLSGEYLGEMLLPFAISPTGVMVAQKGFDCDGFLDLHFYKRGDSYLREFQTFKNRNLSVSDINNYYTALKYDLPSTSFWLGDSMLYISSLASDGKMVYLRITLDVEPISEETVVMPNQATQRERRQAMNRILSDYLEICSKFRANGLSKPERKQRHALLSQWEKTDCESGMLPLGEIKDFWDNHNDICWNRVFINKVICPVIATDLEIGGYDGLRFLFHCFRGHEDSCIHSDSPLAIFCDYSVGKYQPFQLADMLLEYEPDNVDVLRYKYAALKYFLEFSIHEMPSGVLNGYDGASVSDIQAMIEDTNEFERISRKLNMPLCENLVEDCRRYYKAYGDYLQNLDRYGTFEDYLRMNKIPYQSYTSRYDYE